MLKALTTLGLAAVIAMSVAMPAAAQRDGYVVLETPHEFGTLVERLRQAVEDEGMFVVTTASASGGAESRGVAIPGDRVVGVYRNDFAVRMLDSNVAAGIEAPIRFHVAEEDDGTASLRYYRPSAVFEPYDGEGLKAVAAELDVIFADIAERAAAQ